MPIEDEFRIELDPGDLVKAEDDEDLAASKEKPPTAAEWKAAARQTLEEIKRNRVGLVLMQALKHQQPGTRLRPEWSYTNTSKEWSKVCNAETIGLDQQSSSTGNHLGAQVTFSADRFSPGTYCARRRRHGTSGEGHEVLFHELVHALRFVTDTYMDFGLDGGLKDFDDVEEFIAIVVENIYASDNGKRKLRASHHGQHTLGHHLDGSFEFFRIGRLAYPLIASFCDANAQFCDELATVKAPFNPIRAYYQDPDKARRISEGATAAHRDGDSLIVKALGLFL